MPLARGMAANVRDGYGAFRQPKFECGYVIDLNCMRKVKCYRKISIMIIIGEHGSK